MGSRPPADVPARRPRDPAIRLLRELLQAGVRLLAGLGLGIDGDRLGERDLGLVAERLGGLLVAVLLGEPGLVAEEDALVEPALLEVRVGLEDGVDLVYGPGNVAAVE